MTATLIQARDEILTQFKTTWEGDVVSQDLPVLYRDVPQDIPSSGDWARVTIQHNFGEQVTLSGETGARRFRQFGIVTVQIFTETGKGMELSDTLAMIAKTAYEGVTTLPGRVEFRRVRVNEVGQDGTWFQQNVLADFEYDEVR